jgi:hypothetical protein
VVGDVLTPVAPLVAAENAGNPDGNDHLATGDHMHAADHHPLVAGAGAHPPVAPVLNAFGVGGTDLGGAEIGEAQEAPRRSSRVTFEPNRYEPGDALLVYSAD